jgi:hypothetical protein
MCLQIYWSWIFYKILNLNEAEITHMKFTVCKDEEKEIKAYSGLEIKWMQLQAHSALFVGSSVGNSVYSS